MFNVPQKKVNEFHKLYDNHRMLISGCDVFFVNIRMLNGRHTIMDRQTFVDNYKTFTADIDLETSPLDAFIPNSEEESDEKTRLFLVNRDVPEYERIKKRVTLDELKNTLGETRHMMMSSMTFSSTGMSLSISSRSNGFVFRRFQTSHQ